MILSNKRVTNTLISLRGCAGWSVPLLVANHKDRFSHVEAHMSCDVQQTCNQCGECYIRPNWHSPKSRSHARCFGACYREKTLKYLCLIFNRYIHSISKRKVLMNFWYKNALVRMSSNAAWHSCIWLWLIMIYIYIYMSILNFRIVFQTNLFLLMIIIGEKICAAPISEALEMFYGYRDTGQKNKGIRDIFVNI